MTDVEDGEIPSVADAICGKDWWRTVSPMELRQASSMVSGFLAGAGPAGTGDVEVFARALALEQLFDDQDAVLKAVRKALDVMPATPFSGAPVETLVTAENWLARGRAIELGLGQCMELLASQDRAGWVAAILCFSMRLQMLGRGRVDASVHGGTRQDISINKPLRLRPRRL